MSALSIPVKAMSRATGYALALLLVWGLCGGVNAQASSPPALADVHHWLYLLGDNLNETVVGQIEASAYDMVVIDLITSEQDYEDYPLAEVITRWHSAPHPKLVIAYIDTGQAEDFRTYWQPGWRIGSPDWIVANDPDGWEGDYPVAYWNDAFRDIWLGDGGYLQSVVEAGFDGVYLDWVEAYSDENVITAAARDGVDPQEAMIRWVSDIANFTRALKPGFLVIAQNAAELVHDDTYASVIDAIAQEQVWFDGGADNVPPGDCPLPRTEADVDSAAYRDSLSPACLDQYETYPDSTLHVSSESYLEDLAVAKERGLVVFTVDYAEHPDHIAWVLETSRGMGFVPFVGIRELDSFVPVR